MPALFDDKSEKKVEYLELIYDLIFVYIIGRNNSLLHLLEDGFIKPEAFVTYIITTLIVLQIWFYTTLFINRYGTNGVAEHIATFVNMYLLYYMADGTRVHWQSLYGRYNIAWGLILLNLAVQYALKRKNSETPWEISHMRLNIFVLLGQAAFVLLSVPIYRITRIPLSPLAVPMSMLAFALLDRVNSLVPVDFRHLTERVMLYVVFTFGEMIIGISGYFSGGFELRNVYFSLMGFLIVVGLFVSYGFVYDHILDRDMQITGTGFMMLHIFLIAALNNITVAMDFMRESAVALVPKNVYLVTALLTYFLFLFLLEKYARVRLEQNRHFLTLLLTSFVVFILVMAASYRNPVVSIAATVAFIYFLYLLIFIYWRRGRTEEQNGA